MSEWNDCPVCNGQMIRINSIIGCSLNNYSMKDYDIEISHYFVSMYIPLSTKSILLNESKIHYDYFQIDKYMIIRYGNGITNIEEVTEYGGWVKELHSIKCVLPFNKFNSKEKIERLLLIS